MKGQVLEEVSGIKGKGTDLQRSLWRVSLLLLSASCLGLRCAASRRAAKAFSWYVWETAAVKRQPPGSARGWSSGAGQGGRIGWGRGFVLRASDDVLIFISCY